MHNKPHSDETKRKRSAAKKGKPSPLKGRKGLMKANSGSFKKGIIPWSKGKTLSKETKKKISNAKKENPVRYWLGKKRIDMLGHKWNIGKKHTEEHNKKISESLTGKMVGERSPHWKMNVPQLRKRGRLFVSRNRIHSRVVVGDILKRPLLSREIIHHINENPADDRPENLFLFRHRSAHNKWHHYIRRNKLDGSILKSNLGLYSQGVTFHVW